MDEGCTIKPEVQKTFSNRKLFTEEKLKDIPVDKCILEECPIIVLDRVDRLVSEMNKSISSVFNKLDKTTDVLENISSMQTKAIHEIAMSTKSIANTLESQNNENKKLIEIAAGKKQVPISIFIIVVFLFGLMNLVILAGLSGMQLLVNEHGFEIYKSNHTITEARAEEMLSGKGVKSGTTNK